MSIAILDNRIAYGAGCTWWDSIRKVSKTPPGKSGHSLPCCPQCGGMLYEMENQGQWFAGADRYEASGNPGYRKMIEWGRGKCFKNYETLKKTYQAEQPAPRPPDADQN